MRGYWLAAFYPGKSFDRGAARILRCNFGGRCSLSKIPEQFAGCGGLGRFPAKNISLDTNCTSCNNTVVIPFRVTFEPGISLYEQVVFAAKKAVVSGQLRAGEPFPSVRELGKALKINPNTAHKVVMQLVADGVLEVHSGIGTVVAKAVSSTAADRGKLLNKELEQLLVEAKRLGLSFDDVTASAAQHWKRLDGSKR
jgi:GntR family transcriptional regulator